MECTLPRTYLEGFHDAGDVLKMPYNCLGETGLLVSKLSLGTSQLALCHGTEEEPEGIQTVIEAVKKGINYIDCAPFYGETKAEEVLGKALSVLPRQTYYIATKVGRYSSDIPKMFDFSAEKTLTSFEESLLRFGLEYIDVIQVHDVEFAPNLDIIIKETLPALQKIKETGKAKYIGITGYPLEPLKKILALSTVHIDLVLSYCRCTLFDDALLNYIPFFKSKKLGVINAASVGMGLLAECGPQSWHPARELIRNACFKAVQYCKERKMDITKLAISYALEQKGIDTHLIGMSRHNVLKNNLDAVYSGLTDQEENAVNEIKERFFDDLPEKNWENYEVQKYWEVMNHQNANEK